MFAKPELCISKSVKFEDMISLMMLVYVSDPICEPRHHELLYCQPFLHDF